MRESQRVSQWAGAATPGGGDRDLWPRAFGVPQLHQRCRVVSNGTQDHAEVRDHPLEAGGPHPRREADPLYAGAPLHREAARDLPGSASARLKLN